MGHMELSENRQAIRSRNTRDQIVQAALTVFALKGFAAASMDDICVAAGCSKGGLYHHFPTKAAVLSAVVKRLTESGALLPPFEAAAGVIDLPPDAIGRVLIEVWSEAGRNTELREQLRAGYASRLDGSLQDTSRSSALAEILRIGTLVQLLTRGEELDADEAARRLGIHRAA
jgi:AcrR family transcriptional regulator